MAIEIPFDKLAEVGMRLTLEQLSDVADAITLHVHKECVENTPVDTGRARSGWAAETGQNSTFKPPKLNVPKSVNDAVASAYANVNLKKNSPFDPRYVTNNVDYIEKLNEGHSRQAPAGIVGPALASVEAKLHGGTL